MDYQYLLLLLDVFAIASALGPRRVALRRRPLRVRSATVLPEFFSASAAVSLESRTRPAELKSTRPRQELEPGRPDADVGLAVVAASSANNLLDF
jgi:hypothetical protein